MTKKQQLAVDRVNKALKNLYETGVYICGMEDVDNDERQLWYATKKAIKTTNEVVVNFDNRPDVAEAWNYAFDDTSISNEVGVLFSNGYQGNANY